MCFNLLIEILDFQENKDILTSEERALINKELKKGTDRKLKKLDQLFFDKLGLNDD